MKTQRFDTDKHVIKELSVSTPDQEENTHASKRQAGRNIPDALRDLC